MKLLILSIIIFVSGITDLFSTDNISPLTKIILSRSAKTATNTMNLEYASGLMKVNANINESELEKIYADIRTKAGDIWTFSIPVKNLAKLNAVEGIEFIEIDEPISPQLDEARKWMGADKVHSNFDLNHYGFTGKGVVVGIVDAGFDYDHPVFFDSTLNELRIKRVWEQKKEGTPPIGYSYGNELKTDDEIWKAEYDIDFFSHGAHVAGIAAGNDNLTNGRYRGFAPDADLVFVCIRPEKSEWKSTGLSSLVDAFQYIFDYAESVGKPAVANLSWGFALGPHDGTSLFNQACNNMIKPGRAITISAGNNGREKLHISKKFSPTDTLLSTALNFSSYAPEPKTWIDSWIDDADVIKIGFQLYNSSSLKFSSNKCFLNIDSAKVNPIEIRLKNSPIDSLVIIASASVYPSGRTRVFYELESLTQDKLIITIENKKGEINMFSGMVDQYTGYPSAFSSLGENWLTDGNNELTINDLSIADSVFSVAAMVSKTRWQLYTGGWIGQNQNIGNIAYFSSRGATINGRIKPDFAAPGMYLSSAVSSTDADFRVGGSSRNLVTVETDTSIAGYRMAVLAGTSMASPSLAGSIALLMEARPNISTNEIREIFKATADRTYHSDSEFSGMGYARVDLALRELLGITSVQYPLDNEKISIICQSNAIRINFNNEFDSDKTIQIYNLMGQMMYESNIRRGTKSIEIPFVAVNSLYIMRLYVDSTDVRMKFVWEK